VGKSGPDDLGPCHYRRYAGRRDRPGQGLVWAVAAHEAVSDPFSCYERLVRGPVELALGLEEPGIIPPPPPPPSRRH
jgi:hypothetical protein